jgi:hypothetical protein
MRLSRDIVTKVVTSVTFAVAVSVGLLVAGSAYFTATLGTPAQWSGPLASGLSAGLGGVYVGTTARRRLRRRRTHRPPL